MSPETSNNRIESTVTALRGLSAAHAEPLGVMAVGATVSQEISRSASRGAFWAPSAAALASTLFGGMVFSTRFVIDQTDPLTLAFLRFGIGSLCMAPVLLLPRRPRLRPADIRPVVGLGVLLYAVMPASLAAGLHFTYASRGALVLASQPVFTLLLARRRNDEALTPAKLLGIALTVAGLWLALGGDDRPATSLPSLLVGDAILFVTSFCVAVYNVYARPYLQRYPPLVFTALTMTFGALALVPFAAGMTVTRGLPAFTPLGWAAVLYIGTFGAAVGYSLWVWALEATTPTRVAIFLTLNPLAATVLGVALLDEPISGRFAVGFLAVAAGIVAVMRGMNR